MTSGITKIQAKHRKGSFDVLLIALFFTLLSLDSEITLPQSDRLYELLTGQDVSR